MLPNTVIGSIAAGAGVAFLAYCVYFDKKRRSDPMFRQKLIEKRKQKRKNAKSTSSTELPDLKDQEAVQRFFLQEIQIGEELLATGDIETGVVHLTNAVAVCNQPQQLLQVLQQTLPPQVFQMMLMKLPSVSQRMSASLGTQDLTEDDLE